MNEIIQYVSVDGMEPSITTYQPNVLSWKNKFEDFSFFCTIWRSCVNITTSTSDYPMCTFRWCICSWKYLRPWKFFRMMHNRVMHHLVQFLVFETFPGANAPPKRTHWEISWEDLSLLIYIHDNQIAHMSKNIDWTLII